MWLLTDIYRFFFRKFRGKGFGLGGFNRIHGLLWEGLLQPRWVDVNGIRMFLPRHDEAISDVLRMRETYEAEEEEALRRCLKPGMTFVDLGANIGYYSLLASRLVGSDGKVLAFEPDPANLEFLVRNVRENRCGNVEIFPYAVARNLNYADIHLCGTTPGAHSIMVAPRLSSAKRRLLTVGLDDFLGPDLCPDVVKMDIEGAEFAALQGMNRCLDNRRLKTLFIECIPEILSALGLATDDILALLRPHGFACRFLDAKNLFCSRG